MDPPAADPLRSRQLARLQRQIGNAGEATMLVFLGGTIAGPLALGVLCDLLGIPPRPGLGLAPWLAFAGFVSVTGTAFGACAVYRGLLVTRFRKRLRGLSRTEREEVLRPFVGAPDPHLAHLAGRLLRDPGSGHEPVPAASPTSRGDEVSPAE